jgi:hypothetical protein
VRAAVNPSRVLFPLLPPPARSASGGLRVLDVWQTTTPRWREGLCSLCSLFSSVFFKMVKRRLHLEIRIRSSTTYPRSGGAPASS